MADNQKISVKISMDKEKLTAVRTFLQRKNLKIEDEFEQFFDTLFKKHVPKDVQIYIEGMSTPAKKSAKQPPVSPPKASQNPAENSDKAEEKSNQLEKKTSEETANSAVENSYQPPLPYDRFDRNLESK